MYNLDEKTLELLKNLGFEGLDVSLEISLFDYNFLINKEGIMIVFVEGRYTIKTYLNKEDLINEMLDVDDKTLSNILGDPSININDKKDLKTSLEGYNTATLVYVYNEYNGDMFIPDNFCSYKEFSNLDLYNDLSKIK